MTNAAAIVPFTNRYSREMSVDSSFSKNRTLMGFTFTDLLAAQTMVSSTGIPHALTGTNLSWGQLDCTPGHSMIQSASEHTRRVHSETVAIKAQTCFSAHP